MTFEWDPHKNTRNLWDRGIDFKEAAEFDWATALVIEDVRHNYGEHRYRAMGMISGKLHVLVFTLRRDKIRVISLRRANKREGAVYEKIQKD
jgi:uncharacterized DUF497 family protein